MTRRLILLLVALFATALAYGQAGDLRRSQRQAIDPAAQAPATGSSTKASDPATPRPQGDAARVQPRPGTAPADTSANGEQPASADGAGERAADEPESLLPEYYVKPLPGVGAATSRTPQPQPQTGALPRIREGGSTYQGQFVKPLPQVTQPVRRIGAIPRVALPLEAQQTLARISAGGPFPYPRNDGVVFGNRERRLPLHARGYYREYTVPTPGLGHRGARRIVTGARGEKYYTDDHYRTFKLIRE